MEISLFKKYMSVSVTPLPAYFKIAVHRTLELRKLDEKQLEF